MFVDDGGQIWMDSDDGFTKNVPPCSCEDDMTCVRGTPFTKTISVWKAMGAKLVGQPEGSAQGSRLFVQECE
jgi:hypothetical protein